MNSRNNYKQICDFCRVELTDKDDVELSKTRLIHTACRESFEKRERMTKFEDWIPKKLHPDIVTVLTKAQFHDGFPTKELNLLITHPWILLQQMKDDRMRIHGFPERVNLESFIIEGFEVPHEVRREYVVHNLSTIMTYHPSVEWEPIG